MSQLSCSINFKTRGKNIFDYICKFDDHKLAITLKRNLKNRSWDKINKLFSPETGFYGNQSNVKVLK